MIPPLLRHGARVKSVALTASGDSILSADANGSLGLWDAKSGLSLASAELVGVIPQQVAIDLDGEHAWVAGGRGEVVCLGLQKLNVVFMSGFDARPVTTLIRESPGHITVVRPAAVENWSVGTRGCAEAFPGPSGGDGVLGASISRRFILTRRGSILRCTGLPDDVESWREWLPPDGLMAVSLSPDANRIVLGFASGRIRVLDSDQGVEIADVSMSSMPICAVVFAGSEGVIVASDSGGGLHVYDILQGDVRPMKSNSYAAEALAAGPDRTISGHTDGSIRISALSDAVNQPPVQILEGNPASMHLGDDGRVVHVVSTSGGLLRLDIRSRKLIRIGPAPRVRGHLFDLSSCHRFAGISDPGDLVVGSCEAPAEHLVSGVKPDIVSLMWSAGSDEIALLRSDGGLELRDFGDPGASRVQGARMESSCTLVGVSTERDLVIYWQSAVRDDDIVARELSSGTVKWRVTASRGRVTGWCFSPEWDLLAISRTDNSVQVCSVHDGRPLYGSSLAASSTAMRFSQGDRRLCIATSDKCVTSYSLDEAWRATWRCELSASATAIAEPSSDGSMILGLRDGSFVVIEQPPEEVR